MKSNSKESTLQNYYKTVSELLFGETLGFCTNWYSNTKNWYWNTKIGIRIPNLLKSLNLADPKGTYALRACLIGHFWSGSVVFSTEKINLTKKFGIRIPILVFQYQFLVFEYQKFLVQKPSVPVSCKENQHTFSCLFYLICKHFFINSFLMTYLLIVVSNC